MVAVCFVLFCWVVCLLYKVRLGRVYTRSLAKSHAHFSEFPKKQKNKKKHAHQNLLGPPSRSRGRPGAPLPPPSLPAPPRPRPPPTTRRCGEPAGSRTSSAHYGCWSSELSLLVVYGCVLPYRSSIISERNFSGLKNLQPPWKCGNVFGEFKNSCRNFAFFKKF